MEIVKSINGVCLKPFRNVNGLLKKKKTHFRVIFNEKSWWIIFKTGLLSNPANLDSFTVYIYTMFLIVQNYIHLNTVTNRTSYRVTKNIIFQ